MLLVSGLRDTCQCCVLLFKIQSDNDNGLVTPVELRGLRDTCQCCVLLFKIQSDNDNGLVTPVELRGLRDTCQCCVLLFKIQSDNDNGLVTPVELRGNAEAQAKAKEMIEELLESFKNLTSIVQSEYGSH